MDPTTPQDRTEYGNMNAAFSSFPVCCFVTKVFFFSLQCLHCSFQVMIFPLFFWVFISLKNILPVLHGRPIN